MRTLWPRRVSEDLACFCSARDPNTDDNRSIRPLLNVHNDMAPSTATPTNLHRAPIACLACRAAKVRCLISQRLGQCTRCSRNDTECIFKQPDRRRIRRPRRRDNAAQNSIIDEGDATASLSTPKPAIAAMPSAASQARDTPGSERDHHPPITPEVRACIVAALSTLKGKRGSTFSFVTAGDTPTITSLGDTSSQQQREAFRPVTLTLAGLLRPLQASALRSNSYGDHQSVACVSMPSYSASLTLSQAITDPVDSGMLRLSDSTVLFQHFILELNTKWEYVLDPAADTHDSVRQRSPFLFATILFCSSKFVTASHDGYCVTPDAFLQTRLCSLARSLAIRAFAEGNRALETLQAFYLLACWKDPEDDTSYLHSGFAFHVLHDIDPKHLDKGSQRAIQYRRTWLALFRQLKQQNLFFTRSSSENRSDETETSLISDPRTFSKHPHVLPLDMLSCCGADLRRLQSRMRTMVEQASPLMLSCYLDSMDTDLIRWRTLWTDCINDAAPNRLANVTLIDPRLLSPGRDHISTVLGLWESSVRLNVTSTIFRSALMSALQSRRSSHILEITRQHNKSQTQDLLFGGIAGLYESIEASFETLRHLLLFAPLDLRQSPDSVLLLGPNAALYLCLLLSLPCQGILGLSFQKTAIQLIRDVTEHVRSSVTSSQDVVNLHAAYLESLVDIITSKLQTCMEEATGPAHVDVPQTDRSTNFGNYDDRTTEAAPILATGFGERTCDGLGFRHASDSITEALDDSSNLHEQSLANLLDVDFFWDMANTSAEERTELV